LANVLVVVVVVVDVFSAISLNRH